MIMALVAQIAARWQLAVGALVLLILSHSAAYCAGRSDGAAIAEVNAATIAQKATDRARTADSAANTTIKETTDAVEQGNQRARDAATGDDPLGDALRSLREGQTRPNLATD
jgi:hypothetical protein